MDSQESDFDLDMAVIGAGPVGLSLALRLARMGFRVEVFEKNPGLSEHSKAPGIWPATQEILADLEVLADFEKDAILVEKLNLWDADRDKSLAQLNFKEMKKTNYPRLMILPQEKTEQKLAEALKKRPNAKLHFNSELVDFQQNQNQVKATIKLKELRKEVVCKYLIGCDGAHSKVREILGLKLDGFTYDLKVALADVYIPNSTGLAFPRVSDQEDLALGIQIQPNLWRLILPLTRERYDFDKKIQSAVQSLFKKSGCELVWNSEFSLHNRAAANFAQGRVALAGDAAHLNSPVGGQGMNAGIQDGAFLAKILKSALEKDDPRELAVYDKERRHKVRHGVNAFTNKLTRVLLFQRGRHLKKAMKLGNLALKNPTFRKLFLRRLSMIGSLS